MDQSPGWRHACWHRAASFACVLVPFTLITVVSVVAGSSAGASSRPAAPAGQISEGVVPTISSAHVTPLPLTGMPPIPGEDPDPARWVQGPRPNAEGTRPSIAKAMGVRTPSANWSGKIETGTTYSGVGAYWTVPAVVPSSSAEYSSNWIGIGGTGTSNLIQTGTTEATADGATAYYAWYEMLPAPSIAIDATVEPGNQMVALIKQNATDTWEIGRACPEHC